VRCDSLAIRIVATDEPDLLLPNCHPAEWSDAG
jgi:hypothetical protein